MFNFFTVDLSSFYLNIQKDNLYCNRPDDPRAGGPASTSSSTCCAETLLLMAPILSFTCEEAWALRARIMPARKPFIHLARFPQIEERIAERSTRRKLGENHGDPRPHVEGDRGGPRRQETIGDSLEADIEIIDAAGDEQLLRGQHRPFQGPSWSSPALGHEARGRKKRSLCARRRAANARAAGTGSEKPPADAAHPELCPRCAAKPPRSNPLHLKAKKPYLLLIPGHRRRSTRSASGWSAVHLPLEGTREVRHGFFRLWHVRNSGAVWGFFSGHDEAAGSQDHHRPGHPALLLVVFFFLRARAAGAPGTRFL